MAAQMRKGRFRLEAAWAVAMMGAVLLWVGVATLAPRMERGQVVCVDAAGGTVTLEPVHPVGPRLRTFAVPRNVAVQRFDQSLSLKDVRPGQGVEVGVRAIDMADPTLTSIRIVSEAPGSVSAHAPGAASEERRRCETAPSAGSAQG